METPAEEIEFEAALSQVPEVQFKKITFGAALKEQLGKIIGTVSILVWYCFACYKYALITCARRIRDAE